MKSLTKILCGCLILGLCLSCVHLPQNAGETITPPKKKLVFVYLHGFGGEKKKAQFYLNMKEFLETVPYNCEAQNYLWDSVKIKITKAGASWKEAERNADAEAAKLKSSVIDKFEKEKIPYVLIGFSVGSRVILRALEETGGNLKMLRGVYFLGSAMTKNTTIKKTCLPSGMKIINYHSPSRDTVHQLAFNFMEEIQAGGRVGFDDKNVFDNYAVSCAHAHKGIGPHIDYSQLAYAIGYVALLKERIFIPGKTDYNIATPVAKGNVWWNKILRMDYTIKGKPCTLQIEQYNLNLSYFRAISISANGKRKRLARGNNIHAIIDNLNVLPKTYWRKRK
ncbi:MAG: DUF726 domain-containing protein [Kiritimatiellae bacterium]|nr:DUF726 domain-containing protein [Kiritimatiellia bacterium]